MNAFDGVIRVTFMTHAIATRIAELLNDALLVVNQQPVRCCEFSLELLAGAEVRMIGYAPSF